MNEEIVSDCCGAPPFGKGCEEMGICSDCGEHCEWINLEEEDV